MRNMLLGRMAFVLLAAGACGGGDEEPSPSIGGQAPAVSITGEGTTWNPDEVTVEAGDVVEWKVEGSIVHDLKGDDDVVHKAASKYSYRHTYDKPGTYSYVCTIHPGMTGTVTVKP